MVQPTTYHTQECGGGDLGWTESATTRKTQRKTVSAEPRKLQTKNVSYVVGSSQTAARVPPKKHQRTHKSKPSISKLAQKWRKQYTLSEAIQDDPKSIQAHRLHLAGHGITSLDKLPSLSGRISTIYLSANYLQSLQHIDQFQNVQRLSLQDNLLGATNALEWLSKLNRLTHLRLSGNPVAQSPCYREEVITTLPSLKSLDGELVSARERNQASRMMKEYRNMLQNLFNNQLRLYQLMVMRNKIRVHGELLRRVWTGLAPGNAIARQLSMPQPSKSDIGLFCSSQMPQFANYMSQEEVDVVQLSLYKQIQSTRNCIAYELRQPSKQTPSVASQVEPKSGEEENSGGPGCSHNKSSNDPENVTPHKEGASGYTSVVQPAQRLIRSYARAKTSQKESPETRYDAENKRGQPDRQGQQLELPEWRDQQLKLAFQRVISKQQWQLQDLLQAIEENCGENYDMLSRLRKKDSSNVWREEAEQQVTTNASTRPVSKSTVRKRGYVTDTQRRDLLQSRRSTASSLPDTAYTRQLWRKQTDASTSRPTRSVEKVNLPTRKGTYPRRAHSEPPSSSQQSSGDELGVEERQPSKVKCYSKGPHDEQTSGTNDPRKVPKPYDWEHHPNAKEHSGTASENYELRDLRKENAELRSKLESFRTANASNHQKAVEALSQLQQENSRLIEDNKRLAADAHRTRQEKDRSNERLSDRVQQLEAEISRLRGKAQLQQQQPTHPANFPSMQLKKLKRYFCTWGDLINSKDLHDKAVRKYEASLLRKVFQSWHQFSMNSSLIASEMLQTSRKKHCIQKWLQFVDSKRGLDFVEKRIAACILRRGLRRWKQRCAYHLRLCNSADEVSRRRYSKLINTFFQALKFATTLARDRERVAAYAAAERFQFNSLRRALDQWKNEKDRSRGVSYVPVDQGEERLHTVENNSSEASTKRQHPGNAEHTPSPQLHAHSKTGADTRFQTRECRALESDEPHPSLLGFLGAGDATSVSIDVPSATRSLPPREHSRCRSSGGFVFTENASVHGQTKHHDSGFSSCPGKQVDIPFGASNISETAMQLQGRSYSENRKLGGQKEKPLRVGGRVQSSVSNRKPKNSRPITTQKKYQNSRFAKNHKGSETKKNRSKKKPRQPKKTKDTSREDKDTGEPYQLDTSFSTITEGTKRAGRGLLPGKCFGHQKGCFTWRDWKADPQYLSRRRCSASARMISNPAVMPSAYYETFWLRTSLSPGNGKQKVSTVHEDVISALHRGGSSADVPAKHVSGRRKRRSLSQDHVGTQHVRGTKTFASYKRKADKSQGVRKFFPQKIPQVVRFAIDRLQNKPASQETMLQRNNDELRRHEQQINELTRRYEEREELFNDAVTPLLSSIGLKSLDIPSSPPRALWDKIHQGQRSHQQFHEERGVDTSAEARDVVPMRQKDRTGGDFTPESASALRSEDTETRTTTAKGRYVAPASYRSQKTTRPAMSSRTGHDVSQQHSGEVPGATDGVAEATDISSIHGDSEARDEGPSDSSLPAADMLGALFDEKNERPSSRTELEKTVSTTRSTATAHVREKQDKSKHESTGTEGGPISPKHTLQISEEQKKTTDRESCGHAAAEGIGTSEGGTMEESDTKRLRIRPLKKTSGISTDSEVHSHVSEASRVVEKSSTAKGAPSDFAERRGVGADVESVEAGTKPTTCSSVQEAAVLTEGTTAPDTTRCTGDSRIVLPNVRSLSGSNAWDTIRTESAEADSTSTVHSNVPEARASTVESTTSSSISDVSRMPYTSQAISPLQPLDTYLVDVVREAQSFETETKVSADTGRQAKTAKGRKLDPHKRRKDTGTIRSPEREVSSGKRTSVVGRTRPSVIPSTVRESYPKTPVSEEKAPETQDLSSSSPTKSGFHSPLRGIEGVTEREGYYEYEDLGRIPVSRPSPKRDTSKDLSGVETIRISLFPPQRK
eukprot:gb/GECG01009218.1/.p1 GENE.gb/GECG01009218.1/~~gb/GECG01009218.1/.p1  ORF type:complete len:1930 (+),score=269.15 gb/GECG01009218.1/:1-5790(+)